MEVAGMGLRERVDMQDLEDASLLKAMAYIDGKWQGSDQGKTFTVFNPATGEAIVDCAAVGSEAAARAIEAANKAQPEWARKTAKERAALLRKWFNLIVKHKEDLARIMTTEQGKPLSESRAEVIYGASFIEWFAEEAKRVYGDIIPGPSPDQRLLTLKQPVGVVAAITPWNFPCAMITRKAGPALAAGCTIIIKPASETPLSALALAELADRAGIPRGVLNVVTGNSREIGAVLTRSPLVRKLTFTGSTPVGKVLMEQCAATVKKVSMELGGNAPFIVFDDADLDAAVAGAMASKFRNAGQTCVCANRFLVHEDVYDGFVEKFVAAVSEFKVGNGTDEGVTMGPLVNSKAAEGVCAIVQEAIAAGATVNIGGNSFGACFYEPTILTNVNTRMRVFREEIFGPVAPVFKFSSEEEAIAMANDTEFGLASYFYTRDVGRVWRVGEQLENGIVGINEGIISTEVAPFGGVKESGVGREGSHYGIDDYVEIKYLCMGGLQR